MADAIIDGTNINTECFSYSAPKAHESGGKVVNLYYKFFKESPFFGYFDVKNQEIFHLSNRN